jgi:hypothetical protein
MAIAEILPIAPSDLLIDEGNPRIAQPNAGQHKALRALAEHLGTKLQALAADIVNNGLDLSNLPIVTPVAGNPGRYTVLEGNRRLAAIRVLENPESVVEAVQPKVLSQLRRLSKDYQSNPVEAISCLVMDRETAGHWIRLRHTGENAGAGTVPWGSDEAARFRDRSGVGEPHTQALDFLQSRGDITPEVRRKIPATTFKRLIEAPTVRSKMGLELAKRTLFRLAEDGRIAKALMHVVNDLLAGRIRVGDVYTKDQRTQYAADLPTSVVVAATIASGHGTPLSAGTQHTPKTSGAATARIPKKRDRLIPRDCVLGIPSGRLQEIEKELRRMSLEDHTNAVSVLFRVFLELSVDTYIDGHFGPPPKDDRTALQKKITTVLTDLLSRKELTSKQATPVRTACQRDSFLAPSMTMMHEYVHNPHVFPAPGDLRSYWDSLQPFVKAMWSA